MKKLLILTSLLISGGLWAETLNICYVSTIFETYGFMDEHIDKCNDGDTLQFYVKDSSAAISAVAKYCNQDKQITLFEDRMGVCTLKLYSEIKKVVLGGDGLKEIIEKDEVLQKFLNNMPKDFQSVPEITTKRPTIKDVESIYKNSEKQQR